MLETSSFRDLHGKSRLYPDTDLQPIIIDSEQVKKIEENLPENIWDQIQQISKEYYRVGEHY